MCYISKFLVGTFLLIDTSAIQDGFTQRVSGFLSVVIQGIHVIMVTFTRSRVQLSAIQVGIFVDNILDNGKKG